MTTESVKMIEVNDEEVSPLIVFRPIPGNVDPAAVELRLRKTYL